MYRVILQIFSVLGLWLGVMTRGVVGGLSASLQWRMLVGVGVAPSLILGVGMTFMPESPCWLIMRGRVTDTKYTLLRTLKTNLEVNTRLSALRSAARVPPTASEDDEMVEVPPNRHVLAIWQEVIRPRSLVTTLVKAIVSILTLHFIQQSTGIDLLTLEAMAKFGLERANVASVELVWGLAPFLCGRLFPIFLPLFFSDSLKRKTILTVSLMLTGISLVAVNISLVASRQDFYTMNSMAAKQMNKWTTVAFLGSFSL
ncbi:Polyol transporter 5, partial [Linum grandiflorum]